MRKSIFILLFFIAGAIISGCSNEKSVSDSLTLPDENGKDISFEKMEEPALVFFFTGVG